jgi:hypothetical protein
MPNHKDAEKMNVGMSKCRKVELGNGEISERPIIYDPMV